MTQLFEREETFPLDKELDSDFYSQDPKHPKLLNQALGETETQRIRTDTPPCSTNPDKRIQLAFFPLLLSERDDGFLTRRLVPGRFPVSSLLKRVPEPQRLVSRSGDDGLAIRAHGEV